jgi:hypothetical protein
MGSVVGVESVYLGFGKIKDFAGGDHPKADFPLATAVSRGCRSVAGHRNPPEW